MCDYTILMFEGQKYSIYTETIFFFNVWPNLNLIIFVYVIFNILVFAVKLINGVKKGVTISGIYNLNKCQ